MPTKVNFHRGNGCQVVEKANQDLTPNLDYLMCVSSGNAVITDLMDQISIVPMLAGETLFVGIKRLAFVSTGEYAAIYAGNGPTQAPQQVTNSSGTDIVNSNLTLVTT